MHHKRRRPKSTRAGCAMCKPHKQNGIKGGEAAQIWQERKSRLSEREQLDELKTAGYSEGLLYR